MKQTSENLFQKSQQYVPGGVHSPVRSFKSIGRAPRFIQSANGAIIQDVENKSYIDFCMSFGPLILGHRHPQVQEAIQTSLNHGWTYGCCEPYSLELAQFIVDRVDAIEQIRFMNSGTEAVMTAVRLARGYTKRDKILKFEGCYHGHLDSLMIQSGSGLADQSEASSAGITAQTSKDTLVCRLGDLEQVKKCFEKYPKDIAAIVLEPLPANYGLLPLDYNFLKQLQEVCKHYNALLVFDEVISGFRVAFGGMSEKTGITPDLITYGKIIGGGFPVGAIAGPREIMKHLSPQGNVYQAGTLSANPVAMAAGLATLKELHQPGFYSQLRTTSTEIINLLQSWMKQSNGGAFAKYQIIQEESLFWIICSNEEKKIKNPQDFPSGLQESFNQLFLNLLDKGIYLAPSPYEIGFISQAHDSEILKLLAEKLEVPSER